MNHHCSKFAYSILVSITVGIPRADAQFLLPTTQPFPAPNFAPSSPERWEYSAWDCFYTPHDLNKTKTENRNYPDVAAPHGYAVRSVATGQGDVAPDGLGGYQFVGQYQGNYVWDFQSHADAVSSGFTKPLPTNSSPSSPFTIFHAENPSIRQHASSGFIIGASFTGNIYSFAEKTTWTLEDTVAQDLGSVVFQFQNQGREIDYNTLKLRYNLGGTPVEIAPTDLISEREASASHAGFTFTTRNAAEWNISGLGLRSYEIVWQAAGSSCSFQEASLDTSDTYVQDRGIPAKRMFVGTTDADWDNGTNWLDAAGGTSSPEPYANVIFQGGSTLDVGSSTRSISLLASNNATDFTVIGAGRLELGTGFTTTAGANPRSVTFNVPVHMTAFNSFDVGENVTTILNQPFSGDTGFEKRGSGHVKLQNDNTFTGALYLSGGSLTIAGNNSYGSAAVGATDLTYIYLGTLQLDSTGQLGAPGVKVVIGATPNEIAGETRASHLLIKGERNFSQPIEFTGGYNPKLITFTETGIGSICSSAISLHNETPFGMFGAEGSTGDFMVITPLSSDSVRFSGAIAGGAVVSGTTPYAFHKAGQGTVTFSGAHKNYSHQTHVDAGELILASGTNLTSGNSVFVHANSTFTADGNISLSGESTLTVNGSLVGSGLIVRGGTPTIKGSGTIAKSLTIDAGTILSPGNTIGTLHLTGNQTWGKAGELRIDLKSTSGSAASDHLAIVGALSVTATSASPMVVRLQSLAPDGAGGSMQDFNTAGNYTWRIATMTGGISGFDPTKFTFDTTEFAHGAVGNFSVEVIGNDLLLRYMGYPVTPLFSQWASALPHGAQSAKDDADHDGVSNLVEFALGTSGASSSSANVLMLSTEVISGEAYPLLEFSISEPVRPGVTLFLSSSSTLRDGTWQRIATKAGTAPWSGSVVITEGSVISGRRKLIMRDSMPIHSSEPRFFRIEARNDQ